MSEGVAADRAVLDALPTPLVLVGTNGEVAFANAAARGLAGGELPPLPLSRVASGERLDNLEVEWATSTGPRSLLVNAGLLAAGADHEALVLITFEDVTALREGDRRAAFLAEAGDVLAASLDVDANLRRLAELAVPARADWCAIDVRELTGELRRVAEAGSAGGPVAGLDGVLAGQGPVLRDETIVVALIVRGHVVGAVTWFGADRSYGSEDLALASQVAARASTALENAGLHEQMRYIARTLQASLLPGQLPAIPGCELAARYRAAGEGIEVGGDFYDVFAQAADRWAIVLGDVVGKGPPAAALTALARYTMRAGAVEHAEPSQALGLLNEALLRDDAPDRLMSVVHCSLELTGVPALTLASAGHPPALLLRAGRVEAIGPRGPLLGVEPDVRFHDERVELEPGDAVVLYTDGVTDAGAPARLLSVEDLRAAVGGLAGQSADAIAAGLEELAVGAGEGSPRDDIAIVVLRYLG